MVSADGSKAMERITTSHNNQSPSSFSPDGNLLVYLENYAGDKRQNYDILIYNFQDKSTTPFAATEHLEVYPVISPDGRWIAYCSDEEGQIEVYVRSSSGTGKKIKVSREGGLSPLWARSGKQIFYRWREQMWVADVKNGAKFSVGRPRLLFEKSGLGRHSGRRGYDISLDDQRFLMVMWKEKESQPATEMILIQNWFEEIKRLVPVEN